jgi:hypothetical protein
VEQADSAGHTFGVGDGDGVGVGDVVGVGDGRWFVSSETQSPRFSNVALKASGCCCWICLHKAGKIALLCPLLWRMLTHAPWLSSKSAF